MSYWHLVRRGPMVLPPDPLRHSTASSFGDAGIDVIAEPKRRRRATPDGPVFEPQRRSFMFVVGQHVTAAAVLQAARRSYWALISGVSLLAVDTGGIPETGCKAVSIEVIFQPRERALTSVEIEAACARIVAAVTKATGGASVPVLDRY